MAVMFTEVTAVTGFVVIVKVPFFAPSATVTEAGTAATLTFALVRVTTAPPPAQAS